MKITALIGCVSALALAACGDDATSSSSGEGTPRDRALDGALKFARCMRSNGIDMPDPQTGGNGLVRIGPGPGKGGTGGPDPGDPKFRAADEKCRKHLEAGGEARREMPPEHRDAFVAYARCMREQGVNMPDPDPRGGLVFRAGDPGAPNPESAAFRRADKVCHKHLAVVDRAVEGTPAP